PSGSNLSMEMGVGFYLIVMYAALEYGRPQTVLPLIGTLHIPGLAITALGLLVVARARIDPCDTKVKLFIALLILMGLHVPLAVNNYWALKITMMMLTAFVVYMAIVAF